MTTQRRIGPFHRVMVVWCPDWSVTAAAAEAGLPGRRPAAVFHANLVEACNEVARSFGVRRGMRRRDAQSRCADLAVLAASPDRDSRTFEAVLSVLEDVGPHVAPLRPGLVALRSPGRHRGDESGPAALMSERLVDAGVWDNRTGVADELFTAEQAARRARPQECLIVPAHQSRPFLRGLPVEVIDEPDTVSLLRRLGLRTLGDLALLREVDVRDRFGPHTAWVHRVVVGEGSAHLATRTPPPDLASHVDFEPPLDSAEAIRFSCRRTAEAFVDGLARLGLVCTEVTIEATCEGAGADDPPASVRTWLHPRFFTATDLTDRLHWQLQGGFRAGQVTAPVVRIRFVPESAVPDAAHADVLFGGTDERVEQGVARVQGLLGHAAVVVPVLQGGRSPADRQAWVPWGERSSGLRAGGQPWPGAVPSPAPSRVLAEPWDTEVLDASGHQVRIDERGGLSGAPHRFRFPDDVWQLVDGWSGPWLVEESWWEPGSRAVARFQVAGTDGRAWLLALSGGRWATEAGYD